MPFGDGRTEIIYDFRSARARGVLNVGSVDIAARVKYL